MSFEARLELIDHTMLPNKRTTLYKNDHHMQYSIRTAHRITSGTVYVVVSIEYMLCIFFGYDIKVVSKQ